MADTTPNAQAYDSTVEVMRGRFVANISNIRMFKDNPYLKDLSERDRNSANAKLEVPFHGEQFYDDDKFVYVCQYELNETTGKTEYVYYSQEKNNFEKMKYYESKGVLNQLMSAYNNGKIYCFYVDRDNSMMYPTSELIFPYNFASYTVRKQNLNNNKQFVYVAGTLGDGNLLETSIYMKPVKDAVMDTEYRKMTPAKLFSTANPDNKNYDIVEHGKFYVVDFFNESGTLVDTILFQAVDAAIESIATPSQSVVSLDVQVLRGDFPQSATGENYPILSGEDITSVQYNVIAIYNDGTRKNITSYINTNQLVIDGIEKLNSSAPLGTNIPITFTYYPNTDDYGVAIGSPVSKTINFVVTENTLSKAERIIPIIWKDAATGNGQTKSYKLKIYSINNEGFVENRTKAFFDTVKVFKASSNSLTECGYSYTYNPYQQYVIFAPRTVWEDTTFVFTMYSGNSQSEYRFIANFNSGDSTGIFTKALANTSLYGYESGGPLSTLDKSLQNKAVFNRTNNYFTINNGDATFSSRYSVTRDGEVIRPDSIQLYLVNDSTMQAITLNTSFPNTDFNIRININTADSGVVTLVSGIRTNDYIIAKFNNTSRDTCTAIDIFRVTSE